MGLFLSLLFLLCLPGLAGVGVISEFGDGIITILGGIVAILLFALIIKFSKKE